MAKAAAEKKSESDNFTLREMIDYETQFKEPLSDITKDDRPRMKKIAYLAYLKKARLDKNLTFQDYLDTDPTPDEAVATAFGDQTDAEEE